jgi:hypothetical protein
MMMLVDTWRPEDSVHVPPFAQPCVQSLPTSKRLIMERIRLVGPMMCWLLVCYVRFLHDIYVRSLHLPPKLSLYLTAVHVQESNHRSIYAMRCQPILIALFSP